MVCSTYKLVLYLSCHVMIIDALLISNEFLFSSLSKQEVAEYFNQLSSTRTKIQVSANKKREALSNPDMLDIEESPEAPEDQVSAYEQLRLQYIQRNTRIFESLGLAGGARKLLHAPFQCESRSSKAEDEQDSEMDSDVSEFV